MGEKRCNDLLHCEEEKRRVGMKKRGVRGATRRGRWELIEEREEGERVAETRGDQANLTQE